MSNANPTFHFPLFTFNSQSALSSVAVRGRNAEPPDHMLVTIFLRGGADGLSLVALYADDSYYRMRPTIAVPRPSDMSTASPADRLVDLDGFFGLHPALAPIMQLYEAGQLAFVHACGSGDETLSHFEAMATMERGLFRDDGPANGWLARHLASTPWKNDSPLRAVAIGSLVPDSLRGATTVTALARVDDVKLTSGFAGGDTVIRDQLARLYGGDPHFMPTHVPQRTSRIEGAPRAAAKSPTLTAAALEQSGAEALAVLRRIENMSPSIYSAANGAAYPADDLGDGLRQTAILIKSGLGIELACLDHNGFDTHVAQGSTHGGLAGRLTSLARGLAAFVIDLGPSRWEATTVIVMSEFGRRVEENSGAGTDHGHGAVMMVLGGKGIAGRRVHGVWPSLSNLDGPGNLRVTTDYRNVLGEVLRRRVGNPSLGEVFPGLNYCPVGIVND